MWLWAAFVCERGCEGQKDISVAALLEVMFSPNTGQGESSLQCSDGDQLAMASTEGPSDIEGLREISDGN